MSSPDPADATLEKLRGLVIIATQRLLGDTINVTDEDWHRPSVLPEWNRAQVATHIARQADALCRLAEWARTGEEQPMYNSPAQRSSEIDEGRDRSALDLQIDLDTSASRLMEAFAALDESGGWDTPVELRGGTRVPARLLPLARLLEVVMHHVDLDIGYGMGDIDNSTAEWLLEWCSFRLRDRDEFPKLELTSESGFTITLGSSGEARPIRGTSANLLGWLMNRVGPDAVTGDAGLKLPAF